MIVLKMSVVFPGSDGIERTSIRISHNSDIASEPLHRKELFYPPELVNGRKQYFKKKTTLKRRRQKLSGRRSRFG